MGSPDLPRNQGATGIANTLVSRDACVATSDWGQLEVPSALISVSGGYFTVVDYVILRINKPLIVGVPS
jgi:hypothetical protein